MDEGETLPAVMGARGVGTLHRAVGVAGGAKFLERVVDEDDATVAGREEQFKCELPGDAVYWGRKGGFKDNSIDANTSAVIVGLDVPDSSVITKIIIPDTIEDLPVVGIADGAFKEMNAAWSFISAWPRPRMAAATRWTTPYPSMIHGMMHSHHDLPTVITTVVLAPCR